ncbi:MAG: lysophospholipid acyltransferase family protein [Chloroflexota bacterium]|nr:lysophospholipid acyltransferase family protein [Chloroflexota bacterium]
MKKWFVNTIIKLIAHIILKIDAAELEKMPMEGPAFAAANHVNFLDGPVVISHLHPRPTTGLVKKETWESPILGFLFDIWDGIPIDRSIADFSAFKLAKQALQEGKILAVSPEGTRTENGKMIRAKAGIGILTTQCNYPIIPVAYYGHENFKENFRRLKRTPMIIKVGEPFQIDLGGQPKNKETMQAVADAIMMEIARLLPEQYRGYYAQNSSDWEKYIKPVS